MTDTENQITSAEAYVRSLVPNANVSESALQGVLIDAGIDPETPAYELTPRDKDLALAYMLIRIAFNPIMSQRVTDRDADWEHSEGSEQWSRSQLMQFLILARDLLAKWGITDSRIESVAPKWGMKGSGFHKIRRYLR